MIIPAAGMSLPVKRLPRVVSLRIRRVTLTDKPVPVNKEVITRIAFLRFFPVKKFFLRVLPSRYPFCGRTDKRIFRSVQDADLVESRACSVLMTTYPDVSSRYFPSPIRASIGLAIVASLPFLFPPLMRGRSLFPDND